jgi:enediyne biosynthesis protein E4
MASCLITRQGLVLTLAAVVVESSNGGEVGLQRWIDQGSHRRHPIALAAAPHTGFSLLGPELTRIAFTNHLAEETVARNRIFENGSGVAAGDVDGDGLCDLYFCRLEGPNALYRNLGGFRFEDVTSQSGLACADQYSTGAVFADLNGNGHLDLLVNSIGNGTRSFLNDGKGRFTEIRDTGLIRRFGSTSMALADIDGDGDLDLYVGNYRTTTVKDRPPGLNIEARLVDGRIVVTPQDRFIPLATRGGGVSVVEVGEPDVPYINDGQGRFRPVSWTKGAFLDEDGSALKAPPTDWVLSAMFRDLNQDLAPDLYVCSDFFYWHDRLWLNENSKRFRAIDRTALRNMSVSSMSVDFGDINRDGHDDIVVTDMVSRHHILRHRQRPDMMQGIVTQDLANPETRPEVARNTLFLNRGDHTFAEIAQLSGVQWTEWSWSVILLDVDLDGYEDILITTGHEHDVQDADVLMELERLNEPPSPATQLRNLRKFPRLETPNLAYRNRGDLTFEEMTDTWGFGLVGVSHGMALADLDNDGDLDVIINNLNAPPIICRNDGTAPRIAVRLRGAPPNTRGVGARIRVLGGPVQQSQEMICGGRYLSGDDFIRTFAAGDSGDRLTIEVTWRDGRRSVIHDALPNHVYEIYQSSAGPSSDAITPPAAPLPWFEEVSQLLDHRHEILPFDDFEQQPLLPRRLSTLGPGVAWFDLNGNGWDDLVVGAGRGSQPGIFINKGAGGFVRTNLPSFSQPATRSHTGLLGWHGESTSLVLLTGHSNWEVEAGPAVHLHVPGAATSRPLFDDAASNAGPLAMGDVDGDGDLDLFVGGQATPRRYPEATRSVLLENRAGQLTVHPAWSKALGNVGLVNGALFTDLDEDGLPELVLACEWGPLRIFQFRNGQLLEVTRPWGLAGHVGWWNSIASGDFDGDGRLDLVAGNWGRNSKYQRFLSPPIALYYGDVDGNGTVDLFEVYHDPAMKKRVPWRDWRSLTMTLPFVYELYPTHAAFAQAGIEDILAQRLSSVRQLIANTLDSTLFLNRGGRFEALPLPLKAQFAPIFGIAVGDYDGDGHEDLFVAQNFFGVEPDTSRYDGGRGLWLRGDGQGGLTPVPGHVSGVKIYGEQRGAALSDYDGDGRVDLVVAQHNHPTRLFHNLRGKPGLRVRLVAGPENSTGVGAALRLKANSQWGPVREVQAGSGYWSQNSAVQVLGLAGVPTEIQVRWPGGSVTRSALPPDATEITVHRDGRLIVERL